MDNNNQNTGVFINGKAQIAEMLPLLTPEERSRLLNNIRMRNKELADELQAESITIFSMMDLEDNDLKTIMKYINAPVFGIALKPFSYMEKKRILSIADRSYAEETFRAMTATLTDEEKAIKSAGERLKRVLVSLARKRMIDLQ
jgi:flagellar motor switch protein FliG